MRNFRFKTTVAAVLLTASLSTQAAPLHQLLMPSPISIAITVGKWLLKDQKKVYYIQVKSSAVDRHQAIQAGYKYAVEQALGALTLSTVEIQNQQVVRNEIIVASAGYVQDSKVISERYLDNGVEVILDVWVSESRVADRFLAESKGTGRIEGARFADTLESFNHAKGTTTQAVQSVLSDYPRRAFDIKVNAKIDREGNLILPTTVKWNNDYIYALWEVLKNAGPLVPCNNGATNYDGCPQREKIRMRYAGNWFGTNMSEFGYNHPEIIAAVRAGLEQRYPVNRVPVIQYTFKTVDGNSQTQCRQINLSTLVTYNQKEVSIDAVRPTVYDFVFQGLPTDVIRRLDTVTAEIAWGTGHHGGCSVPTKSLARDL